MVSWFPRRGKRSDPSRMKARRDLRARPVSRVDLSELTPPLDRFLGHVAYVQLAFFEMLSRAVMAAPSTDSKEAVSRVAAVALTRHHRLIEELSSAGLPPSESMEPYADAIDEFQRVKLGNDWYELLISYHVVSGILNDCFVHLAQGLPGDYPHRIAGVFEPGDSDSSRPIVDELRRAIDDNPRLASRLALWGRCLVGDTLLMARSALLLPKDSAPDDARLEPVFTELIAAHTRRMDELGLTA